MFVVTEAEAAAIRAVYEQSGEFSAAVELRRLFPAVTDTAQARACALGEAAGSGQGSVAPRSAKRSVPAGTPTSADRGGALAGLRVAANFCRPTRSAMTMHPTTGRWSPERAR